MRVSRRRFLAGSALFACAGGGLGYMRWWEPRRLVISHIEVPISSRELRGRVRILHLSDLHASSVVPHKLLAHAVDLGLRLEPDLVCLTGDYVTGRLTESQRYARLLGRLAEAAPTYASFGNHDGGSWVGPRGGSPDLGPVRALLESAGAVLRATRTR